MLRARLQPNVRKVVRLERAIPRIESEDGQPDGTEGERPSTTAQGLVRSHVEAMNALLDQGSLKRDDVLMTGEGVTLWPSLGFVGKWLQAEGVDGPRMSLIVHLARTLGRNLESVCRSPRKVLSRARQLQPVGRVQEIDPACVRWLARQPGTRIQQKAGPRQEVQGVTRFETADTAENRVARDLLVRAILAGNRYLAEHRAYPGHERVSLVSSFRRLLRSLLRNSDVGRASQLVGAAKANYVLQHDLRYRELWIAYQKLVKQQRQEDDLWCWRHRAWSEVCGIALMAALDRAQNGLPRMPTDILLRGEHVHGAFVDRRTAASPWIVRRGDRLSAIDLVGTAQLRGHPLIPQKFAQLCPDLALVVRDVFGARRAKAILGVWSLLEFDDNDEPLAVESLLNAIRSGQPEVPTKAMLVLPQIADERTDDVTSHHWDDDCWSLRVSHPIQRGIDGVELLLRDALGLKRARGDGQ